LIWYQFVVILWHIIDLISMLGPRVPHSRRIETLKESSVLKTFHPPRVQARIKIQIPPEKRQRTLLMFILAQFFRQIPQILELRRGTMSGGVGVRRPSPKKFLDPCLFGSRCVHHSMLSERLRRWSNKPDFVGSIPVTTEFFIISCDSN